MVGEAIMKLQLRSRAALETDARTGWRAGGGGGPRRQTLLDTIQSEQSSVARSTFSSASKCQAVFAHKCPVRVRTQPSFKIRARLSRRRQERPERSRDTGLRTRSHISLLRLARWTDR